MYRLKRSNNKTGFSWQYVVLAAFSLLLAGSAYRVAATRLEVVSGTPVTLPIPLSEIPASIYGWEGIDIPIPVSVQRVAANDDYISRLYKNNSKRQWASVYVAYSARPRTMSGHRPRVCYVGSGWVHDSTEQSQFRSISGKAVPCLIHRFHKPSPQTDEIVVLNFYLLNGEITCDESGFSGVGWRTPNISGNIARYVTQVQISSTLENSVRSAAKDLTDIILDYFPDEDGIIKAEETSR